MVARKKEAGKHQRFSPHSKIGSGASFDACVRSKSHQKGVHDAQALCAYIGKRAYGKTKFGQLSAAGRRRHH